MFIILFSTSLSHFIGYFSSKNGAICAIKATISAIEKKSKLGNENNRNMQESESGDINYISLKGELYKFYVDSGNLIKDEDCIAKPKF